MCSGLRSQRPGEQSEAIVKFPRLFEKYPFPVLINTALLKGCRLFSSSWIYKSFFYKTTGCPNKHEKRVTNCPKSLIIFRNKVFVLRVDFPERDIFAFFRILKIDRCEEFCASYNTKLQIKCTLYNVHCKFVHCT